MARSQTLYPPTTTTRSRRRSAGWQSALAWGLVALPIVVFGFLWNRYAVNVPKWDDHALRGFLAFADQEPTFFGKVYQLFKQHNEHRIVYDRIITALDYWLTGHLNFVHLMVVGNLSLVGLLLVFVAVLRQAGRSGFYAVPVALVLFNLSQWENMYWGMAALQNFSVVLWVLAAFYCLSYTNRLGLALVFALLATFTSGNGLMVWPIGLLLLILRSAEPRRSFRLLIGWGIAAILVVGLYFVDFKKPDGIAYVRPGLGALLKGWFAVIGAAAEALPVGSPLRSSVLLGGFLTLAAVGVLGWIILTHWLTISRALSRVFKPTRSVSGVSVILPSLTLFYFGSLLFILGTAAIVAWARTGFGADLLITSRYKMYSLTILSLLYVYAVSVLPNRMVMWAGIAGWVGGLGLAWLSYYSFLDETIWWRHWNLTNQFNWTYTSSRPITTETTADKQYTEPEPAFYDSALPVIYGPAQSAVFPLTVTKTTAGYVIQNSTIVPLGLAYLLLRSAKRTYLFPVWQNRASLKQSGFGFGNPFTAGFTATLGPGELGGVEAGTYHLMVLTVAAGKQLTVYPTNQTITSTGQPIDTTKKNW